MNKIFKKYNQEFQQQIRSSRRKISETEDWSFVSEEHTQKKKITHSGGNKKEKDFFKKWKKTYRTCGLPLSKEISTSLKFQDRRDR